MPNVPVSQRLLGLRYIESAIKLTKISCDIAATRAAEPFNTTTPCGFSSITPSGNSQDRQLPTPWLFRADVAQAFPCLSNSTGVARGKNWSQDRS